MPLTVMNAILAQRVLPHDGSWAVYNPVSSAWVSSPDRDALEGGDVEHVEVRLQPLFGLLTLIGGDPGLHKLAIYVGFPWPEADLPVETSDVILDAGEWSTDVRFGFPTGIPIKFKGDGLYTLKFLVDGVPAGGLPLLVHWK